MDLGLNAIPHMVQHFENTYNYNPYGESFVGKRSIISLLDKSLYTKSFNWQLIIMFPGPRNVFQILSASSRKASTRKWLKPEILKVGDWRDIIYDNFKNFLFVQCESLSFYFLY